MNNDQTLAGMEYFGYCNQDCEVEQDSTCYAIWSPNEKPNFGNGGLKERKNCIFPFKYEGKWYNGCMDTPNKHHGVNYKVCATSLAPDGTLNELSYCGPECRSAGPAAQCVKATGSGAKGNRCVFPYYNNRKHYSMCHEHPYQGRHLCATGVNLRDMTPYQWGYCDPKQDSYSCPKKECITVGGADLGQTCKFPFRNKWTRELHWGCTTASLEGYVGQKETIPSALWCATETTNDDEMVSGKWGFCSNKCPEEQGTNCYIDSGRNFHESMKCIFPFIYNGLEYKQCTFIQGHLKCPIRVDENGLAQVSDMRKCGPSKMCYNSTTINGNAITIGYTDVGVYTNDGKDKLSVTFTFETGVEDSSEHSWEVQASVSAGFDAFGASFEASLTVGGGGAYATSTSKHQTHELSYEVAPKTRVVLSQQVLRSGVFESRTFKLILKQYKLGASRNEEPIVEDLEWGDIASRVKSKKLN